MPNTALPQIAVIVGSNRRDSINRKLAAALIKLGAGIFDAKFLRIDDLPMYNQDNEATLPPEVARTIHPVDEYELARTAPAVPAPATLPEVDLFAGVRDLAAR